MEKKLNRGPTNSSRSSPGTDVKKVLDVAVRQGPRTAVRRREPPIPKVNDAFRKQHQPQKNGKVTDKRPKPRGMYYSGVVSRSEETGLEEFEEPELGSVFSPGSKKQSLNHLLRFSLPPRTAEEHSQLNHGAKKSVVKKHKYNKEHFVQATCQFIVKENGDYSHYMNDPDVLVDWNLIEQVRQHVSDETTCPICLYPPKAAKMTRCGHVYCWPCILHHINLSEESKTKCPICHDCVKTDDLRSVVLVSHKMFQVSDTITFKLMKKPRNGLTAYPADAEIDNSNGPCNLSDCNENNKNNKLFLANARNVLDLIEKEDAELKQLLDEDISATEAPFIEQAVQILYLRKNDTLTNQLGIMKLSNDAIGMDEMDNLDSIDEDAGFNKFSYFYQAEDGQHLYLHAMNAKMLEHSYGSLEFAPKTVTGQILQLEGDSITEELRHRMRYLQHLPVTCPFEVAEIKLHEPIVKKETLEYFQAQIEKRKKKRQRQAKEDKKRAKRIEADENKKMGRSGPPDFSLESDGFPDVNVSHDMFPEFLDKKRRTESESLLPSSTESSSSELTSPKLLSTSLDNTHGGPSFASMLTSERKSLWPTLKGNISSSADGRTSTSFGKTSNAKDGGETSRKHRNSEGELEDYDVVPNYNVNLGDVIAQGLAGNLENRYDGEENSSASGKKKKKKNKHKLVFSNHMVFPAK